MSPEVDNRGLIQGMTLDRETLKQANCWFASDSVSGQPAVTEFKRRARLHQARWREQRNLPMGGHGPGDRRVPNGSKISTDASPVGANFLSDSIRDAVTDRLATPEPYQNIDERRLFEDLLSSMPMCFNLFGEASRDQLVRRTQQRRSGARIQNPRSRSALNRPPVDVTRLSLTTERRLTLPS